MSMSIMSGCVGKSVGKSLFDLSTASRTRCLAVSMDRSGSNSTMMDEKSGTELLVIFFTSAIDFSCFSIGRVTKFSISSGEVPGYAVLTTI